MTGPVATLVIRPQTALDAYSRTSSDQDSGGDLGSFGAVMQRAMQDVVATGQDAETKSMQAIEGQANITDVVTAVSKADLALQTTVAIRDRMVQAYQTIMNMTI
jgi:flagellar hook-basal body complex protein FliE